MAEVETKNPTIEELYKNGAHFGFNKSRRHPSANSYLYTSKNRNDIFDLEKTNESLEKALEFVKGLAEKKETILLVGGKNEARNIIRDTAESMDMPYVASRWIGGTLTNFTEIKKRIETMLSLISQKEKGELAKYTKKERLLIDRDIEKLQKMFWGISKMSSMPKAIFIVDPRYEDIALKEAKLMKIPVIALCGTDNNFKEVEFVIPGNDSSQKSIKYFADRIKEVYIKNKSQTITNKS